MIPVITPVWVRITFVMDGTDISTITALLERNGGIWSPPALAFVPEDRVHDNEFFSIDLDSFRLEDGVLHGEVDNMGKIAGYLYPDDDDADPPDVPVHVRIVPLAWQPPATLPTETTLFPEPRTLNHQSNVPNL